MDKKSLLMGKLDTDLKKRIKNVMLLVIELQKGVTTILPITLPNAEPIFTIRLSSKSVTK